MENVICFIKEKQKRVLDLSLSKDHTIINKSLFISYVDQLDVHEQCQFVSFVLKIAQNLTHDGMFVDKAFMCLFINDSPMSMELIQELYRRFNSIKCKTYKELVEQRLFYLLDV